MDIQNINKRYDFVLEGSLKGSVFRRFIGDLLHTIWYTLVRDLLYTYLSLLDTVRDFSKTCQGLVRDFLDLLKTCLDVLEIIVTDTCLDMLQT